LITEISIVARSVFVAITGNWTKFWSQFVAWKIGIAFWTPWKQCLSLPFLQIKVNITSTHYCSSVNFSVV